MTLDEARQISWMFNQESSRAVVERIDIREETAGNYSVVVEPVEGERQIFSDPLVAQFTVNEWIKKFEDTNNRYFAVAEDGTLIECDFATWLRDKQEGKRTETKFTCSPESEATIVFHGRMLATWAMDGDVKPWLVQFFSPTQNVHHGGPAFETFEKAKAFVDLYIAEGSPEPGTLPYLLFMSKNNPG